ncbi:hypothetical protein [Deinococcus sp. SL84]|uniref:hypothetical protein n=1 Tax=Deinococcus sp. SL84 TaxID=2994663 RepID=UPI002273EA4E|nr:hypothetical protein [Deinococcus sp. SL84]MCY1702510.1 hypothetical protein [Deinococcus sp. SL84]
MIEFLKALHNFVWPDTWVAVFPLLALTPTPLALATAVLFVWSLAPAFKGQVGAGFLGWLRLTWALTLLPAVTGIILAVSGGKVASAVPVDLATLPQWCQDAAAQAGLEQVTRYCQPVDPPRDLEHWMYTGFTVLSLLAVEALARDRWNGEFLGVNIGLKLLPVITLFLAGCVYMIGRVAVLPGNSAGA